MNHGILTGPEVLNPPRAECEVKRCIGLEGIGDIPCAGYMYSSDVSTASVVYQRER